MTTLELFCDAIKQREGFYIGSRSWRNNNPGNLRFSKFQAGVRDGYSYFLSYEAGFQALLFDVRQKCRGLTKTGLTPQSTISEFSHVWAPANDGNDPDAYAAFVALQCGLTVNSRLFQVYQEPLPEQKILCFLLNYLPLRTDAIEAGMEHVKDFFNSLGLPTSIDYVHGNHVFDPVIVHTHTGNGNDIPVDVTIADPSEVRTFIEPYIKDHHFVIVSYAQNVSNGTPVELSEVFKGAIVGQLPVLPVSNSGWVASYFAHELLHGWYFRLNTGGIHLVDDVHKHSFDDTRPDVNYSDIVKRLIPYKDIMFRTIPDTPVSIDEQKIGIMQQLVNALKSLIALLLKGREQ